MRTFARLALCLALAACASRVPPEPAQTPPAPPAPTSRPAQPRPAEAPRQAPQAVRMFAPIYFDYDKADVREDQRAALSGFADYLKARPALRATLEGHCDERGTIEYNLALGQRRAESVATFLARAGVAAERIAAVSYGKERPADAGGGEAAWARNRRVEMVGR